MSRVVLATASDDFEMLVHDSFHGVLNGDVTRAGSWSDPSVLEEALTEATEVVAVGPGIDLPSAVSLVQSLDREHPDISVVVVGYPSADLLEAALRAGARDVVAPDAPEEEVRDVFERAMEAARRRRGRVRTTPDARAAQRTIVIVSAKGGSGKTAVAANLAVAMARMAPGLVVAADLDLQFGDMGYALGLDPQVGVTEAARSVVPLDATTVTAFLTRHPSELFLLAAPNDPVTADSLPMDRVVTILGHLQSEFPYVVIDTGAGIDEAGLVALDHATDVVLVGATDVASVRALQKTIVVLQQLQYTDRAWILVLNRSNARVGLAVQDIEATLGMRTDVAIPSSRALPISMNQGRPLVETDPHAHVSRAIRQLAVTFVPQPPSRRRGLFRRRGGFSVL
jgi:pilus assembly protein CpaE